MPKTKKFYKNSEKYKKYNQKQKKGWRERGRIGCYRHPWTPEEIDLLFGHPELMDRQISQITKHSITAIQVKRSKILKERIKNAKVKQR